MWRLPLSRAAVVLIVVFVQCVNCLRLNKVEVPPHPVAGSSIPLHCIFDMEGDELYSVKWYKRNAEFYRYLPKDIPPAQVYDVDGVSVDLTMSGENVVTLENISLKSSGIYRCEVSAEAPSFITIFSEGEMNVIALPSEGPRITGGRTKYQMGDTVRVNCTSSKSKPAAMLSWTIKSNQAPKEYLKEYPNTLQDGLEASILGLQFQINEKHIQDNELKLRCTATIAPIYHQSNEESVIVGNLKETVLESRAKDSPSQVAANRRNHGCILSVSWWTTAIFGFILRLVQG